MKPLPTGPVASLLWYLREALRGDEKLAEATGLGPDDLVRGTYERQPIDRGEDGATVLYASELPCLALQERTVTPLQTSAGRIGLRTVADLWYLLRTPRGAMVDGVAVPGEAMAQRACRIVIWRIAWLLQHGRIPWVSAQGEGVWILDSDGGVFEVKWLSCEMLPPGEDLAGMRISVSFDAHVPPYPMQSPAAAHIVDVITTPVSGTAPAVDVTVTGRIDLATV